MPTYEYRCAKCGEHLEVFQSFSEAPLTKHAHCGGKLAKVFSPAGIVLKGSGFYKTDNRNSKRSGAKDSDNGSGDSTTKSSEANGSGSGNSESKQSDSGKSESGKSESGKSSGSSSNGSNGSNGSSAKPAKKPEAKTA